MKWNNKIILTVLLTGGLISVLPHAFAAASTDTKPAQREGRRGQAADRVEKMAKELNLTDDQKEKIKDAFKDEAGKMKSLRDDQSLSKEDRRAKLKDLRSDIEGKIKTILTPEQQQKWTELRANARKQKKDNNQSASSK